MLLMCVLDTEQLCFKIQIIFHLIWDILYSDKQKFRVVFYINRFFICIFIFNGYGCIYFIYIYIYIYIDIDIK
jgi:hypothetical protein